MDQVAWSKFVGTVVRRMQLDNEKENRRLTPYDVKMILRRNFKTCYPEKTPEEIVALIDFTYPKVMLAYRGPAPTGRPMKTADEIDIDKARRAERRRAVKANRGRR